VRRRDGEPRVTIIAAHRAERRALRGTGCGHSQGSSRSFSSLPSGDGSTKALTAARSASTYNTGRTGSGDSAEAAIVVVRFESLAHSTHSHGLFAWGSAFSRGPRAVGKRARNRVIMRGVGRVLRKYAVRRGLSVGPRSYPQAFQPLLLFRSVMDLTAGASTDHRALLRNAVAR